MKFNVNVLKFTHPVSELGPQIGNTTILGPYVKGWSAIADEDQRIMLLKVRKAGPEGKVVTKSYRIPFETIQFYEVAATQAAGEPPEPK